MSELASLFNPQSVAIIGASATPGKIGNAILQNMIDSGYKGELYPINPKEEEILGYTCYPSVAEIPGEVEMAVLAVPARFVLPVAKECGEKGVKHLIGITAGFRETGKEGAQKEQELLEVCNEYGMRLVGPNCLGIADTHTPMDATFMADFPLKGRIAFISQSGALCASILDWSLDRGIGFSKFISLGNKADLNEADFILDAAADPNSSVIFCYIEDVADGDRFMQICSEVSRSKPVVVLKSGTSSAGAQAASSHTGALAGSDRAYDTAFRQSGILRAYSMEEFFNYAAAFSYLPIPKGDRVAIVTNSGGPGIICTDSIEANGLTVARFSKETTEALRENLPPEANIYDPVDLIGDADKGRYLFAMDRVLADDNVDAVVVMYTPVAVLSPEEVADAVITMRDKYPAKPVAVVLLGGAAVHDAADILEEAEIPCYFTPEPAVRSIAGLVRYANMMDKAASPVVMDFSDVDRDKVREVFDSVKADNRVVLLGNEASAVAEAYGIPVAPIRLATSREDAANSADELGYPVVMKVASPHIVHKTDIGGVKLNLSSREEVEESFVEIMENVHRYLPDTPVNGVEVQKMMPPGTEIIIGMSQDVQFGPMLMFGLGGIYVNLLQDVAFRLVNGLTVAEVDNMIQETKAFTLLKGYRGDRPKDIKVVKETIARVAQLVWDFREITEMDINPLFAYDEGKGIAALDVKITLS